jgi:hypothetical protein
VFSSTAILGQGIIVENGTVFDGTAMLGEMENTQWAVGGSTNGATVVSIKRDVLVRVGVSLKVINQQDRYVCWPGPTHTEYLQ